MLKSMGQSRKFGSDFRLFNDVLIAAQEAGFSEAFWRRLAYEDGLMFEVKDFVEQRQIPIRPVSLKFAREVLGRDKVISAHQAAKVWGRKADSRFSIRYNERTLFQCVNANITGEADWRLVFCNGLSLWDQFAIQGVVAQEDGKNQPCFDNDWIMSQSWVDKQPEQTYYLINFKGKFANKNWDQQTELITLLGERYERCDGHVFGEAIQTIFLAQNGERLAENWYHWSVLTDCEADRVGIGAFGRDGLLVSNYWRGENQPFLRVCVSLKPDF